MDDRALESLLFQLFASDLSWGPGASLHGYQEYAFMWAALCLSEERVDDMVDEAKLALQVNPTPYLGRGEYARLLARHFTLAILDGELDVSGIGFDLMNRMNDLGPADE